MGTRKGTRRERFARAKVSTGGRRPWFTDLTPLRISADFRRLWFSQLLSAIGGQMTAVAVSVQIYQNTRSSFAVGLVGLAGVAPLMVLGLLGGTIADVIDRRKLVLINTCAQVIISLAFVFQATLGGRELWPLYGLTALQAAFFALGAPANRALVPRLLPARQIAAAAALLQLSFQVSILSGALFAGVLIAALGVKAAYCVDAAGYFVAFYAVLRLPPMPTLDAKPPSARAIGEGLRFVRRHEVVGLVLLVDLVAMIFGMPRSLFPALAERSFGGSPQILGALYAAPAVGGLISAIFSGRLSHVRLQGRAVLVAALVWGGAIALFALASSLLAALVLLAIAGAGDMVSGVFRATILQVNSPDSFRGRVGSVGFVLGVGGPWLGDAEAGAVAALTSPVFSAVSGGIACAIGVTLIAIAFPAIARYEGGLTE